MSRFYTLLLIVVFLATCNPVYTQDYTPPPDDVLWAWWNTLNPEQKIAEIRAFDRIEHVEPEVFIPDYAAFLAEDGTLYIKPLSNNMEISIYYLKYKIALPTTKIDDFYTPPKITFMDYIVPTAIAFSAGIIGGAIIIGLMK